jgi:hypothetical protein
MPSKQARLAIGLRPPRTDAFGSGSSGEINAHCASVINSTFLAIEHLHSTASRTMIQASRKSRVARIHPKTLHWKGYETGSTGYAGRAIQVCLHIADGSEGAAQDRPT